MEKKNPLKVTILKLKMILQNSLGEVKIYLFIAKSEWQVILQDPKGEWAVIYFSKTLSTPEGVDVISRSKIISEATWQEIKSKMLENDLLKKHIPTLVDL